MSTGRPYLIEDENATGKMLQPLPTSKKAFRETWMQELLYNHPSILPISDIDDMFSPLTSIGREIGNIDNLFICPNGLLTIVETKLWRNPEAHRTVVAQVLEYASKLSTWSYQMLDQSVSSFMLKRTGKSKSLFQLVTSSVKELDLTEIEFEQKVQNNLARGKFALLIVGDKIYPAATQLSEVIQSAPHMQFTMAFVELNCFKLEKGMDWPLIVVPQIVTKTNEVTRAIVKVIYEEKKPEIEVTALQKEKSATSSTSSSEFTAALPSNLAEIFQSYIEKWQKSGFTIFWGKVGFSLRIPWKDGLFTIFEAYPDNLSIFQEKRLSKHDLPADFYQQYKSALMESPVIASAFVAGKRHIRYDQLTEDDIRFLLLKTDQLANQYLMRGRKSL